MSDRCVAARINQDTGDRATRSGDNNNTNQTLNLLSLLDNRSAISQSSKPDGSSVLTLDFSHDIFGKSSNAPQADSNRALANLNQDIAYIGADLKAYQQAVQSGDTHALMLAKVDLAIDDQFLSMDLKQALGTSVGGDSTAGNSGCDQGYGQGCPDTGGCSGGDQTPAANGGTDNPPAPTGGDSRSGSNGACSDSGSNGAPTGGDQGSSGGTGSDTPPGSGDQGSASSGSDVPPIGNDTNPVAAGSTDQGGPPNDGSQWLQTFNGNFSSVSADGKGTQWTDHLWYDKVPPAGESWVDQNGMLNMKSSPGGNYTTLDPNGNGFAQKYGYFEANIKLPTGQGTWPAFWLFSQNHTRDGNAPGAEIDVMEGQGSVPGYYATIHKNSGSNGLDQQNGNNYIGNVNAEDGQFHRYGVDWQPDHVTYYFDGKPVATAPTYDTTGTTAMQMILGNVEGDMNGSNQPNGTSDNSVMQVAWVHAYQRA